MSKRTLIAILYMAVLSSLPALASAQALRSDLMYCGLSSATGAELYLGVGPFNEVTGCVPDANTQALMIARSGSISGNGAAWLSYLNAGGVIITEYSSSDNVYNELFGTAYSQGSGFGNCTDNLMPSLKLNPSSEFWQLNSGLTETPVGLEGCGYDLSAIVNGENDVTALGGIAGTAYISLAVRPQGAGVLWLAEADWQDNEISYSDDSRNLMGVLISGGNYNFSAEETAPVPSLSIMGLLFLMLGMVYLGSRRMRV